MPCSDWQINLLRSPQLRSVFSCHRFLSWNPASVMLFLTSVFLVLFFEKLWCRWTQQSWIGSNQCSFLQDYNILNIFQLTTETKLKLQESFANVTQPSSLSGLLWKVSAYEKSVDQKRKKVLQFHKISLMVTVASMVDWKWNTSKRCTELHNMLSKLTNHILVLTTLKETLLAFLWGDPDQDFWSKITQIMAYQRHRILVRRISYHDNRREKR